MKCHQGILIYGDLPVLQIGMSYYVFHINSNLIAYARNMSIMELDPSFHKMHISIEFD